MCWRPPGIRAETAGNIGRPLCEVARSSNPPEWLALELSSFQLHDAPNLKPAIGVLTNLAPNHLDRYNTLEEYYGDKALLFQGADSESFWVTNADDPAVQEMTGSVAGTHVRFSIERQSGRLVRPDRGPAGARRAKSHGPSEPPASGRPQRGQRAGRRAGGAEGRAYRSSR